ncbi:MAG: NYN domain-containing protein [Peptoniphilaceae bacterium]|uniref:NYN domain-containing protein n=1 Tax=Parvimonas sp. TaxID=1944660 RepID=UPI0025F5871A|nr:NYN domain-containing protein [Parvimonas sp.]MCI5996843.1 NYN domain-containing protein [Parvimonas sp.]MDD7764735.1 NYN domain-containing protein [Peptoniphilaceae bacterium]MDY3050795.1 NYN domain-containing protein [Parvimonas sp.]
MESKKLIIIDGYNILHAWNKYIPFLKQSFESARNELIYDMGELSKLMEIKLLLVFDAYKVNFVESNENIKGIEVIYTRQNETADKYIEKKLDEIGRKISVSVGTDDTLIQKLVMQRGGIILTSEELLYRYENLKNKVKRLENKKRITNKSYLNTLDEKVLKQIDDIEKKLFGKE